MEEQETDGDEPDGQRDAVGPVELEFFVSDRSVDAVLLASTDGKKALELIGCENAGRQELCVAVQQCNIAPVGRVVVEIAVRSHVRSLYAQVGPR